MDLLLSGLKCNTCLVYLDDVIIFGHTFEEHLFHLKEVFERFREAGLKLKPSKCSFCQSQVNFLGHVVSTEGIRTDPSSCKLANSNVLQRCTEISWSCKLLQTFRTWICSKPLHRLTEKKSSLSG